MIKKIRRLLRIGEFLTVRDGEILPEKKLFLGTPERPFHDFCVGPRSLHVEKAGEPNVERLRIGYENSGYLIESYARGVGERRGIRIGGITLLPDSPLPSWEGSEEDIPLEGRLRLDPFSSTNALAQALDDGETARLKVNARATDAPSDMITGTWTSAGGGRYGGVVFAAPQDIAGVTWGLKAILFDKDAAEGTANIALFTDARIGKERARGLWIDLLAPDDSALTFRGPDFPGHTIFTRDADAVTGAAANSAFGSGINVPGANFKYEFHSETVPGFVNARAANDAIRLQFGYFFEAIREDVPAEIRFDSSRSFTWPYRTAQQARVVVVAGGSGTLGGLGWSGFSGTAAGSPGASAGCTLVSATAPGAGGAGESGLPGVPGGSSRVTYGDVICHASSNRREECTLTGLSEGDTLVIKVGNGGSGGRGGSGGAGGAAGVKNFRCYSIDFGVSSVVTYGTVGARGRTGFSGTRGRSGYVIIYPIV